MKYASWLLVIILLDSMALAARPTRTFPGVAYYSETRTNPPMRLFVAEVDLTCPRVHLRVAPGGPDPDGPGKWQTVLMQPTKIAGRERFDLVVNGDFFSLLKVKNPKGTNYVVSPLNWASVTGPAVTDGREWAVAPEKRPCLVVHKNQRVSIEKLADASADDQEVIAGNIVLVEDGKVLPKPSKIRNPRTAVGLDKTASKLFILVVDGRKPGVSIGLSDAGMAGEMLRLGCWNAINLDGGGSSVMAVRDVASGEIKILNTPSDGHERAVANVLGITVDP